MANVKAQFSAAALSGFTKIPENIQQDYTAVVTQVYPLKAEMSQLENFCDQYLNVEDDPNARDRPPSFKPVAPWVLMQVVNYGKIGTQVAPASGWFSQHELAFGFPVGSYEKDAKGNDVFKDWALVYPFIFVDNPLSIMGGRQIYGWPKRGIVIDRTAPSFEPNTPNCLISVSLPQGPVGLTAPNTSPEYADTYEKFLEIYQQRPFLSGRAGVGDALMSIPRAITGSFSAAFGMLQTFGLSSSGSMNSDMRSLLEMLQRLFGYMSAFMPAIYGGISMRTRARNTGSTGSDSGSVGVITLKQFRDAANPSNACYQAIVRSRMSLNRTIDGGLLFDPLSGDSTGGIHINLLRTEAQPIISDLGIEVSGETSFGDDSASAAILRPVIPFWSKVDLSYGAIDYQYWRTAETGWSNRKKPGLRSKKHINIKYCELGSGAKEELAGPFDYQNVNLRIFPLEADQRTLQDLINTYLDNSDYNFVVPKNKDGNAFVCILIINFAKMKPERGGEPGKDYADRMFRFVVPVQMSDRKDPKVQSMPVLIPLYTFVGEEWNFVTEYEVYGRFTLKSTLASPQNTWMVHPDPETARRKTEQETGLLRVETMFVTKPDKDLPAETRAVLGVDSPGPAFVHPEPAGDHRVEDYLKELGLSYYYEKEFYCIAMKRVLDAEDVHREVYKSLVGVKTEFHKDRVDNGGHLSPVKLKIYEYPGLPLVKVFGLKNGNPSKEGDCDLHVFDPKYAFYIAGNMTDSRAQNLSTNIGGAGWMRNPDPKVNPFLSQPGTPTQGGGSPASRAIAANRQPKSALSAKRQGHRQQ